VSVVYKALSVFFNTQCVQYLHECNTYCVSVFVFGVESCVSVVKKAPSVFSVNSGCKVYCVCVCVWYRGPCVCGEEGPIRILNMYMYMFR